MAFDHDLFRQEAELYLSKWNCRPDSEPFFTHASLLWPARRNDQPVMLKMPNPLDDEVHGAEILKIFGSDGAVEVLENIEHVQLLERIESDKNLLDLVRTGRDDEATTIICDVISRLHRASARHAMPACAHPFAARSKNMMTNARSNLLCSNRLGAFESGFKISEELVEDSIGKEMLLHGDVHHFNVLHSSTRGWLAIDPKGISGHRAYEYASLLVNPHMHPSVPTVTRLDRQASIASDISEIGKETILRYTLAHALQCAAWSNSPPDHQQWFDCAQSAAKLLRFNLIDS